MTLDDFSSELQELQRASAAWLNQAARDGRYRQIPIRDLQKIYEKHRNINFNTPSASFELVIVSFGFVELEIIHQMKKLYFDSLNQPSTWHDVVKRGKQLAHDLEAQIVAEMEEAFERTRPVV